MTSLKTAAKGERHGFAESFEIIVYITIKTFRYTNLVVPRCFKLAVDTQNRLC